MLPPWLVPAAILLLAAIPLPLRAADPDGLYGGEGGRLHLLLGGVQVCDLAPYAADPGWTTYRAKALPTPPGGPFPYVLEIGAKEKPNKPPQIEGAFQAEAKDGTLHATWTFTAKDEVALAALAVVSDYGLPDLVGGSWTTDTATGVFPALFGGAHLFGGETRTLTLAYPNPSRKVLKFTFAQPTSVTVQDNRQWDDATFTIRLGRPGRPNVPMQAAERFTLTMDLSSADGVVYSHDLPELLRPVTLKADDTWVPLQTEVDIVPGSALDLSGAGFTDGPCGPCGSKGRVVATPDGHFAFADELSKPRRFYGVNLCFGANYLPKEGADRLLDRLVALGYNTIRIHHYESGLTTPPHKPGFDWDPARVDQLDYLMAGCAKRGLWITTDLFVSRPVAGSQIGSPEPLVAMDDYKILVPVSEAAFQDWAKFARKFLDRVNPYTGKRVADDPALAWISLINEGPSANSWGTVQNVPAWKTAWNRWLAARYPARQALTASVGDLRPEEDPGQGTVALPGTLDGTPRGRLAQVFCAETEKASYERMRAFLRDDLKCRALLTNLNNTGPGIVPLHAARDAYDYVDQHFYIDHPVFLEKPWHLPSFCSNANPVAGGGRGGSSIASVRLWGKPFTVSEYNYAGPSRYRGVGGILTGAMAALQDWDALWRFSYSHTDQNLFEPARISYFDLASDPLNQAADRLAILLYLRRDLAPAPGRVAVVLPRKTLQHPPPGLTLAGLQAAAWATRIGSLLVDDGEEAPADACALPVETADKKGAVAAALAKSPFAPLLQPGAIRSETGEFTLVPREGVLTIDTPRSAGGYADVGKAVEAPGAGVRIDGFTAGATVFISSLDPGGAPIRTSRRLLVTHLTDLQDTGTRYGEAARQTLLEWGNVPHLVRDGAATVHIALAEPAAYTVWALSTGGRRTEKVAASVADGQLVFTAAVRGAEGARMLYEIAR